MSDQELAWCDGPLHVFIQDENSWRCSTCGWIGWPHKEVEMGTGRVIKVWPHRRWTEDRQAREWIKRNPPLGL